MIDVFRLVENQARVYGYKATLDEEEAIHLESMIEQSKPQLDFTEWDELIFTPFRYALPIQDKYSSRFCPPNSKRNAFYCSEQLITTFFEYSYHFMRQRIHLQLKKKRKINETGTRTSFSVSLEEEPNVDVSIQPGTLKIMAKSDYSESHRFAVAHYHADVIKYPSVRDPSRSSNYAVFKIERLGKHPKTEKQINYFYDYSKKTIHWIDQDLTIAWSALE